MIAGGIKYKEQRFNPIATGVGSLLFFVAIIGKFKTPPCLTIQVPSRLPFSTKPLVVIHNVARDVSRR